MMPEPPRRRRTLRSPPDDTRRPTRSRARAWLRRVFVLLGAAALLGAWVLSRSHEPEPAPLRAARGTRPHPRPLAPVVAPSVSLPNAAQASTSNATPHITRATVDDPVLCTGQSTFLRMDAEDPDDTDLRYQAMYRSPALGAPRFGFGRWLRFVAPERAGRYELVAVVEDPSRARDELPLEVVVEDCDSRPEFDTDELRIRHTELDAMVHEFDMNEARDRARDAGKVLRVLGWHFGDGESAGSVLTARHHYPVVLDRRYAYYLVTADVSVDGVPLTVEYGLSFYSYAAANLDSGYVALAADVQRGDDESSSIDFVVTFSNLTPFAAWARELEVTCLDAAGLPEARWRERLDLTVPGEASLAQNVRLDRRRCPGGASYELFGEADGGYAVGGLWSYKLRPSLPVADRKAARERARLVLGTAALPAVVGH